MARLLLSSAAPGAGKTLVGVGLAAALRRRRVTVQTFDAGAGAADAAWLALASGRDCVTLGASLASDADFALIEAGRGLHDGAAFDGADSAAGLAKRTKTPVVLVLDAEAGPRGAAAQALGAATFDPELMIAGVILDRLPDPSRLAAYAEALERRAGLAVLGALPRNEVLALAGGAAPSDDWRAEALVAAAAEAVVEGVDVDRILQIAATAAPVAGVVDPGQSSGIVESGSRRGEVYLVGAGPGDIELLTLRALRLMRRADVVLYDRLANSRVMDLLPAHVERISVGKQPDRHELPQEEICALMADLALSGKRVLRLKGGDPFMFGRGGEEIEYLADRRIPFEICPGITAAAGAASYAGIPLTHRDHAQACIFVTGHGKTGRVDLQWPELIRPNQTVVIYMALRTLETLTSEFIARGAPAETPAAIVDNATRSDQRVIVADLGTLAARTREARLKGPAIVIVGSVVTLRAKLTGRAPGAPYQPD